MCHIRCQGVNETYPCRLVLGISFNELQKEARMWKDNFIIIISFTALAGFCHCFVSDGLSNNNTFLNEIREGESTILGYCKHVMVTGHYLTACFDNFILTALRFQFHIANKLHRVFWIVTIRVMASWSSSSITVCVVLVEKCSAGYLAVSLS